MQYANYDFYTKVFEGTLIPQKNFLYYANKASGFIDNVTLGRLCDVQVGEDVKNAMCEVAEIEYKNTINDGKIKSSESVGTHSESYDTSKEKPYGVQKYQAVSNWLARTGLMYRGVGR